MDTRRHTRAPKITLITSSIAVTRAKRVSFQRVKMLLEAKRVAFDHIDLALQACVCVYMRGCVVVRSLSVCMRVCVRGSLRRVPCVYACVRRSLVCAQPCMCSVLSWCLCPAGPGAGGRWAVWLARTAAGARMCSIYAHVRRLCPSNGEPWRRPGTLVSVISGRCTLGTLMHVHHGWCESARPRGK
jgi:hypothetical protein